MGIDTLLSSNKARNLTSVVGRFISMSIFIGKITITMTISLYLYDDRNQRSSLAAVIYIAGCAAATSPLKFCKLCVHICKNV